MDAELLRAEVSKIPRWYHCLDFGHGVVTPGYSATQWGVSGDFVGLPVSLEGKSVLDIGAWDGFYSFEAERRGARGCSRRIRSRGAMRKLASSSPAAF